MQHNVFDFFTFNMQDTFETDLGTCHRYHATLDFLTKLYDMYYQMR